MREIKFRGYCDRDSEWRYGYYITDGKIHEINTLLPDDKTLYGSQIDIDSLGQYTGLKDQINRNEIYEHDIINHLQYGFLKVEWDYENTGWCCLSKTYKKFRLIEILQLGGIKVGNIYENPELLKD